MANLAYYLQLGLAEAGRILPVTWATFGFDGSNLPILVAHPAVINFFTRYSLNFRSPFSYHSQSKKLPVNLLNYLYLNIFL